MNAIHRYCLAPDFNQLRSHLRQLQKFEYRMSFRWYQGINNAVKYENSMVGLSENIHIFTSCICRYVRTLCLCDNPYSTLSLPASQNRGIRVLQGHTNLSLYKSPYTERNFKPIFRFHSSPLLLMSRWLQQWSWYR